MNTRSIILVAFVVVVSIPMMIFADWLSVASLISGTILGYLLSKPTEVKEKKDDDYPEIDYFFFQNKELEDLANDLDRTNEYKIVWDRGKISKVLPTSTYSPSVGRLKI